MSAFFGLAGRAPTASGGDTERGAAAAALPALAATPSWSLAARRYADHGAAAAPVVPAATRTPSALPPRNTTASSMYQTPAAAADSAAPTAHRFPSSRKYLWDRTPQAPVLHLQPTVRGSLQRSPCSHRRSSSSQSTHSGPPNPCVRLPQAFLPTVEASPDILTAALTALRAATNAGAHSASGPRQPHGPAAPGGAPGDAPAPGAVTLMLQGRLSTHPDGRHCRLLLEPRPPGLLAHTTPGAGAQSILCVAHLAGRVDLSVHQAGPRHNTLSRRCRLQGPRSCWSPARCCSSSSRRRRRPRPCPLARTRHPTPASSATRWAAASARAAPPATPSFSPAPAAWWSRPPAAAAAAAAAHARGTCAAA